MGVSDGKVAVITGAGSGMGKAPVEVEADVEAMMAAVERFGRIERPSSRAQSSRSAEVLPPSWHSEMQAMHASRSSR